MKLMLALVMTLGLVACKKNEEAAAPAPEAPSEKPEAAAPTPTPEPEPAAPSAIPAPPDVAAPPADAKKTTSGLAYKVLTPGTGPKPSGPTAQVKVHYTGWTTDGKMFDSSVARGEPITFPLNGVIAGWSEGVQLMSVGEKTRIWIPEELAYKGDPSAPQGMLVFDIELLEVIGAPSAP